MLTKTGDQTYSKNSDILKYYYNLKYFFVYNFQYYFLYFTIFIYFIM